jgi:hypothetical protein
MIQIRWSSAAAFLLAFLWAAPGSAADPAKTSASLAQVPADAPLVLHLKGFERTKDRVLTMVNNAVPKAGAFLRGKIEEGMKGLLQERELRALAKEGSIFVFSTDVPRQGQDEPNLAVIVQVSDYKAFRDGLLTDDERKNVKSTDGYETANLAGKDVYLLDRKGFAAITGQKEVAAKLAKKEAGLDTKLDKETAQKLLDSDMALYVDMVAINKEYGDQIKAVKPLADFFIQQAGAQMEKNQVEALKAIVEGVFQFLEDSRSFLVAAEFRPEGLAFHGHTKFGPDTKINSHLKKSQVSPLADLAKLPAGQLAYFAMILRPETLKALAAFAGEADSQSKDMKAAYEQFADAGPSVTLSSFAVQPSRGVQAWAFKDPAKAAAAQVKIFQALKEGEGYGNMFLKGAPVIKQDAQSHRGFKLTSVTLKWDFEKMLEKSPQAGQDFADAFKKMMGEGSNVWFGTDGKSFVSVTAADWAAAQKLLDDFLDGKNCAGQQAVFMDARKQLPAQTTIVGLIDLPYALEMVSEMVGPAIKAQGIPFNVPVLKASKGKTFVGMALTLQPEIGSLDLWIPGTAAGEIRKMVEPLVNQISGQAIQ